MRLIFLTDLAAFRSVTNRRTNEKGQREAGPWVMKPENSGQTKISPSQRLGRLN
jgi:hypothetical protein